VRNMGNATAISAGGTFTGPPGTVWFGPGDDGTPRNFGVIRLTVPQGGDGDYRLETSVRSLFDAANSADSDVHVVKNGQEFKPVTPDAKATPGGFPSFTLKGFEYRIYQRRIAGN